MNRTTALCSIKRETTKAQAQNTYSFLNCMTSVSDRCEPLEKPRRRHDCRASCIGGIQSRCIQRGGNMLTVCRWTLACTTLTMRLTYYTMVIQRNVNLVSFSSFLPTTLPTKYTLLLLETQYFFLHTAEIRHSHYAF